MFLRMRYLQIKQLRWELTIGRPCAAMLTLFNELTDQELTHPPVYFLFTVQEEVGLVGASFLEEF